VAQVPEGLFFGVFTIYGLVMLIGRIVDSLADPIVGHASDRSRSRLGRRRAFMIWGIGPMVVIPVLIFWPPGEPGSLHNAVWLAGLVALYFVAFTVYVAPYLALLPEVAGDQAARVSLSRMLGLTAFPALVVFGLLWPVAIDVGRAVGSDPARSMRILVVAVSLLAFALCLGPIAAVDERRFTRGRPSELSLLRALGATMGNSSFAIYVLAQILFVFGINLVQPSLPYYATVVLGRSEGFAALLSAPMLVGVAAGFALIGPLARRFGPKRVMMVCVAVFCVPLASLGLLEAEVPGGPHDRANLSIALTSLALVGFPVAGFLILPNVLLSQLIDADEQRTGANRAAMFFGVQGFLTKWVYGVSMWALTFLMSRFGNSPEEPLGVLLVGPVAGGACLVSLALYACYPERRVIAAGAQRSSPA
jgi:GPH family glycoside/pentoside/hexuronide:cation symporter